MSDFISNFPELWEVIKNTIYFLLGLLIYRFTGLKGLLKIMEEYMQTKFRTNSYFGSKKYEEENKGQSFDKEVPVYRLNKTTGELEKTDEVVDVDALVNSHKETALSVVLDRYLPVASDTDEVRESYDIMRDNLDLMSEAVSVAEEYRSKFNLPADMPINQIFDYVNTKAVELDSLIKEKLKGDKKDEKKKNDEESK